MSWLQNMIQSILDAQTPEHKAEEIVVAVEAAIDLDLYFNNIRREVDKTEEGEQNKK